MQKVIIAFSILLSLMVVSPTGAQQKATGTRDGLRPAAQKLRENIQNTRETYAQERRDLKADFEAKKEEARSRFESEKAELKTRLAVVKDERKKQAVEKISNQIKELNERMLNHFSDVLEKLEKVLSRISDRVTKAESRGLNISAVRTEIANANTAITVAKAAVVAQAGKVYTVVMTTSTEGTLKRDVGGARQVLHKDLSVVKNLVKAAHEAVRKAATTLAKIPRVDDDSKSTSTPPVSTSTPPVSTSTPTSTATSTP